jgi:predicted small integral membrane protein
MFEWMAWTLPVAVFFICIALMLAGMTVWVILPIETTRGDRLFIGLLSAAYVNLAFVGLSGKFAEWFQLDGDPSIWISFVVSMFVLALVMRKG